MPSNAMRQWRRRGSGSRFKPDRTAAARAARRLRSPNADGSGALRGRHARAPAGALPVRREIACAPHRSAIHASRHTPTVGSFPRVQIMVPVSEPGPDEVVIRVEAAPLNPSDMGLLFGGADMAAAVASGSAERPVVTASIPDAAMRGLTGRVGTPMPVGNEGAGTVVAAGESAAAQALRPAPSGSTGQAGPAQRTRPRSDPAVRGHVRRSRREWQAQDPGQPPAPRTPQQSC
jgi:hypothetical protein